MISICKFTCYHLEFNPYTNSFMSWTQNEGDWTGIFTVEMVKRFSFSVPCVNENFIGVLNQDQDQIISLLWNHFMRNHRSNSIIQTDFFGEEDNMCIKYVNASYIPPPFTMFPILAMFYFTSSVHRHAFLHNICMLSNIASWGYFCKE